MKKLFSIIFAIAILASATPVLAEEGVAGAADATPVAQAQEEKVCDLSPYLGYLQQIQAGTYEQTLNVEGEEEALEDGVQDSENASSTESTGEAATSTEPEELAPTEASEPEVFYPDELTVRKELMVRIIDCAIADAVELRASIETLSLVGVEEDNLQDRFVNRVNEAIRHYEFQKTRAKEETLTISGIKQLAHNLREWRGGPYASLERSVQNFTLWTKNQDLIDTAQTRLSHVRQTIKDFRLGGNDLIEESFDRARFFVDRARDANRQAQTGLIHEKSSQEVLGDLKDAVSDLYRAYNEFFTLSGTVKGYLLTR